MEAAEKLFMKIWIFMHGIAAMIATKSINLSDAEAEKMLSEAYADFLAQEKLN